MKNNTADMFILQNHTRLSFLKTDKLKMDVMEKIRQHVIGAALKHRDLFDLIFAGETIFVNVNFKKWPPGSNSKNTVIVERNENGECVTWTMKVGRRTVTLGNPVVIRRELAPTMPHSARPTYGMPTLVEFIKRGHPYA